MKPKMVDTNRHFNRLESLLQR